MKPVLLAVSVLLLAACSAGDDAAPAAAAPTLGEAECRLLAERHRDFAISVAPQGQEEAMRELADASVQPATEACLAGEMFDARAYECVSATTAGSAASHACMGQAAQRS